MKETFAKRALDYHRQKPAGKLKIVATKPLATQEDLALAYSPGVAAACELIVDNPQEISSVTSRGNLVAVISNGTAVLGLGNIGPLAAKPVMEGKAVLFKKFADIDVFDIEIDEKDPDKLIEIIASLEPTFGGINLEDIKAPDCFKVEQELKKRMKIPVFHDDQHGTAIIVAAAFLNAVELQGKKPESVKLVCSGAGAAAIACLDILCDLGVRKENITVCDQAGVIYRGRNEKMDPSKEKYAAETKARTLAEALPGADVFLGLSAAGVLKGEMVKSMAAKPIIFGLANPEPEIRPEEVLKVRDDAIIATGRSDYPNQVNNVLCFPYIFRGALDVGATSINTEMKLACVRAIAALARTEAPETVAAVYQDQDLQFGPNYIIPKPFDPRLVMELAPAVAEAAMKTGVATRPIEDMASYYDKLSELVFRSSLVMRPIFTQAKAKPVRVAYGDGEDERVLRALQTIVEEKIAQPILIGRREVVETRLQKMGIPLQADKDFEIVDPENDARYHRYWTEYHALMERKGTTPDFAKTVLRTNTSVIANLMVHFGEADAALIGPIGQYERDLKSIQDIIGLSCNAEVPAALSVMALEKGELFITDPYVNADPTPAQLANIAILAAEQVRRFGGAPKIALLSHSNFGTSSHSSAEKMREALRILEEIAPDLEVEGEMHADAALSEGLRNRIFPNSRLHGKANLLVMPNIDAANIAVNLLKSVADGQPVGPILMGANKAVHILTPSVTTRGIINMTAIAAVDAQVHQGQCER